MVNIRVALEAAFKAGIITEESIALLVAQAKRTYFPDRNYKYLLHKARGAMPESERMDLQAFLGSAAPDAKREDAILLLNEIKSWLETSTSKPLG